MFLENLELEQGKTPLVDCLISLGKIHNRDLSRESVLAGLPLNQGELTPSIFHRAAKRAGFVSRIAKRQIVDANTALFPVILLLENDQACLLVDFDMALGQAEVIFPELSGSSTSMPIEELNQRYSGFMIYCRPEFQFDSRAPKVKVTKDKHWFWGVIAENRKLYRDVIIAAILINLFAVAMPLFVMNVYDRVVPNHATDTLWVLSAGVLIVLCADLILKLMRSWFVDLGASRADVKISASIMEKVLGMKMVDRPESTGSYAANIQSFESIRSFIGSLTLIVLVDLPFVFLFSAIIAIIHPVLVLPIVVGALIVLVYAMAAQGKMHQLSEESMRASSMRNATLIESLGSLETVKSFGVESKVQTIWEDATLYITRTSAKIRLISASITNGAQWIQNLVAIAIMVLGVYLLVEGELTQGGLIAAYLLSSRAMAPISQTAGLVAQYHNAATAMKSLDGIMEQQGERPENKNWISRPHLKGNIEFKNVSFKYPDDPRYALHNASFKIKEGEHVAILGRNGSGKTTLEKIILGLYQPETGSVLVDGVDLRQLDPSQLRRNIGYVPQDVSLFFGSLRENITISSPQAEDEQIIRAAELAGLSGFVNNHPEGFDMQVGERGQLLSGGQRQTVALARAAINDPSILLLDEPTGSLDHTSEATIMKNLAGFSQGKTMVVITHRSSLLALVDRIIVIDSGKIVADGPKEEVMEALRQGRVGSAK